jgi:hypothetical protein
MPHLLVDISAHGYGHVSQTAPVVCELARRVPGLRVTVRSAAPLAVLKQRFHCDFEHVPAALDFGMAMVSAVEVDVERSLAAYRAYHQDWQAKVARAAAEMSSFKPDLLLANVPYLSLAAAKLAGIPAVALCSLNWADIYAAYAHGAEGRAIHGQMLEAYNGADLFLKLQPAMPMHDLSNAQSIGPVADPGHNRRAELVQRLGATRSAENAREKLVLVAMGGIEFRLPVENWPRIDGVRWLIPHAWNIARDDVSSFDSLGMPFSDVLASCDAVLTKPGYGTFADAACAGVPVLYVSRGEWPEEPYLVDWLQQNGACLKVDNERLHRGELQDLLAKLWRTLLPARPRATGADEAAQIIQRRYF